MIVMSATGHHGERRHAGGPRRESANRVRHWRSLAVHQFVRIGHDAFIGGMTAVVGDVIPYAIGGRQPGSSARPQRGRAAPFGVAPPSELKRMRRSPNRAPRGAIFGSGGGFSDNLAKAAETYAEFRTGDGDC